MAAVVQTGADNNNAQADPSFATASDVTSGNDLIICWSAISQVDEGQPSAGDIALSGTATFGTVEVSSVLQVSDGGIFIYAALYRVPITGSGTCTVDLDFTNGIQKTFLSVTEVSGLSSAAAEDTASSSNVNSDTAPDGGTVTTAGAGIIFGCLCVHENGAAPAVTEGTDFTEAGENAITAAGPDFTGHSQYRIVGTGTTDLVEWTTAAANDGHVAVAAAFADAGGGGGLSIPVAMHHYNQFRQAG